jgi:hypothetical protein
LIYVDAAKSRAGCVEAKAGRLAENMTNFDYYINETDKRTHGHSPTSSLMLEFESALSDQ